MSLLDVQEAFDRAQQPEIVLAAFKVEVCRREVAQRTVSLKRLEDLLARVIESGDRERIGRGAVHVARERRRFLAWTRAYAQAAREYALAIGDAERDRREVDGAGFEGAAA